MRPGVLKRWVNLCALPLTLIVFLAVAVQVRPTILQFGFNWYAVLSLIAFVANLFLLWLVLRTPTKVNATYCYILYLCTIVIWSGGEVFQRFSITREGALFWSTVSSVGWILLPVTLIIFVVVYVRKEYWLRNPVFLMFMLFSALGILYLNLTTDAFIPFTQAQLVLKPWGFNSGVERFFPVFLVWTETFNVVALSLIYKHIRTTKQENEKKQGILFIVAFLIPMVIGSTTDAILPIFGINWYPSLTSLTTITAVIITYAILKYGLLIFSPITIASNILETMQEVLIVVNPAYVIEYANTRAEELLNYDKDDLTGRKLEGIFQSKYGNLKKTLLSALKHERFAHLEKTEVVTQAGKSIPVSISAARVSSESGEIKGYILSLTDITNLEASLHDLKEKVTYIRQQNKDLTELGELLEEEKASVERQVAERTRELTKSRAQLMSSINSLEMGFVMVNPHLEVVVMNGAASHMLSELQLHNQPKHKYQKEDSLADIEQKFGPDVHLQAAARSCIENGGSSELKEILVGSSYFHIYLSPMFLERKVIGVVILIQDVTESKVIERSRDEFFSIASHELRTPLTAIIGYTALIKSLYADKTADKRLKHMVEGITEGGTRMTRIVEEFLNMSRLEQGKLVLNPEKLDMEQLVLEVMLEMQPLVEEKSLQLHFHKGAAKLPLVEGDRDRIKEVLINLVGNAIKFTDKGKIMISAEPHPAMLQIRVHDTGHGIPKENQALLFHKFQQAGSSLIARETSNGTGLGLYISKLMVEAMGGIITLESSAPHHGSTFSFTLPRA
jgi:PAS domain S-box-containing protein